MVHLPPMVIQPYVENAIWHGLLHKNEKGKVTIDVTKNSESLIITVQDNGIGRQKAAAMKSKNSTTTKSYGMQITAQRILQLNKQNKIDTIDLIDNNGEPMGTKVVATINLSKTNLTI
jgi:LytS/YehU family sensor histidine kinase